MEDLSYLTTEYARNKSIESYDMESKMNNEKGFQCMECGQYYRPEDSNAVDNESMCSKVCETIHDVCLAEYLLGDENGQKPTLGRTDRLHRIAVSKDITDY